MTRTKPISFALCLALVVAGCTSATEVSLGHTRPPSGVHDSLIPGTYDEEVRFGLVMDSWGGPDVLPAVELALLHANDALAANGAEWRFTLVLIDVASEGVNPLAAARDAVENGVVALVVSGDRTNHAVLAELNYNLDFNRNRETPIVCGDCVSPELNFCDSEDERLRDLDRLAFRTSPNLRQMATVTMRDLLNTMGSGATDGSVDVAYYGVVDTSRPDTWDRFDRAAQTYGDSLFNEQVRYWGEGNLMLSPHPIAPEDFDAETLATSLAGSDDPFATAIGGAERTTELVIGQLEPAMEAALRAALERRDATVPFLRQPKFLSRRYLEELGELAVGELVLAPRIVADTPSGERFTADFRTYAERGVDLWDAHFYDATATLVLAGWIGLKALGGEPSTLSSSQIQFGMRRLSLGESTGTGALAFGAALQRLVSVTSDGARFESLLDYDGASGPVDFGHPGTLLPGRCLEDLPHSGGDAAVELVLYRVEGVSPEPTLTEEVAWDCPADRIACPLRE